MIRLNADFSKEIKKMRPLHGFNNSARKTDYGEILPDFLRLAPPIIRLHDTVYPYGGGHYVDVNNIFTDWNADPDDEDAYDFTLTDLYIKPIAEAGIEIMYRLGCNIEHAPKKYNVFPPQNFSKWADVCEHIVRHYNKGWANGFNYNIRFWEIWNEPDGLDPEIEPFGPPNWQGTAEQYYELYRITANRLKEKHPEILVGGYSSCYILGKHINGRWEEGDASFFTDFLEYISDKKTKAPLDFFTWHGYLGNQGIKKIDKEFTFVDETLNKYGFTDTLRIDSEWNCCVCDKDTPEYRDQFYINMRNEKGASHIFAALCEMQRAGVDIAMFYDAQLWKEYGPLFHVPSLKKTKTYNAFKLFGELYENGTECESSQEGDVYTLAVKGELQKIALANVSFREQTVSVALNAISGNEAECTLTDKYSDEASADPGSFSFQKTGSTSGAFTLKMPPCSFACVTIR